MPGFLRHAGATLIAIGIVAAVVAIARSAIFAPNAACVGRSRELIAALQQYVQDNDERFPSQMNTEAGFKAAVLPYTVNASEFICPATNKPYAPNSALAGQALATYAHNQGTTIAFQDSVAHADGLKTITYLDGTVTRGGIVQGDPTLLGMQNVSNLMLATNEYIQDNDEHLPPTDTQPDFQDTVGPYIADNRDFYSPQTGQPYAPNPNISEMALAALPEPDQVVVAQSSVPEPDGLLTIGYLDGHVVHGDLIIPSAYATGNIKQLMLAVLQYIQDYDLQLPPTNNYSAFEQAISPYVRSTSVFYDPRTGLPYVLNASVSGKPLSDFSNPSAVFVIKAPVLDQNGVLAIGYLDGHVVQKAYHIVRTMAVGADNSTRLFWSQQGDLPTQEYGKESLWTINANGGLIDQTTIGKGLVPVSATVDSSNTVRLLSNNLEIPAFPVSASAFEIVGAAAESTISAGNDISSLRFGPFDGWTPTAIGAGANDQTVALWDYYDGTAAVWLTYPQGGYKSSVNLTPPDGGGAIDLAVGADNNIHVLWSNADDSATIQNLNSAGVSLGTISVGPVSGDKPTGLIVDPSGNMRLLWGSVHARASVWTIDSSGNILGKQDITGRSGFHAVKLGVGDDGNLRILWINTDDAARLDIVQPDGTVVSSTEYQPYYTP